MVDTFVTAIRTFARTVNGGGESAPMFEVRRAQTREHALRRVACEAIDAEWAAEMLLEEASSAFLIAEAEAPSGGRSPARWLGSSGRPTLPSADVPTGFIWPAHTGRVAVRSLAATGSLSVRPAEDANGGFVHRACGYVLRTHVRHRFESPEAARQALVRAARERTQLDTLLASDTVVVAQMAPDGACWVWTLMPELANLANALAEESDHPATFLALCDAYGRALADAARIMIHHGFDLELEPRSFGLEERVVRYVGEVSLAPPSTEPGARFAAAVAEVTRSFGNAASDSASASIAAALARAPTAFADAGKASG